MTSAKNLQSKYYADTAEKYDEWHINADLKTGHAFAMFTLCSIIELYSITSILDVGAGTGRTILFLQEKFPKLKIVGVEPVESMRKIGHKKGISPHILIEGDGYKLNYADDTFDLVCEFGVLHHVDKPNIFVKEMLRCSRKVVFISDVNTIGQGRSTMRLLKRIIKFLGLWKFIIWLKTKGKMYSISQGDGLYYSYTIFDSLKILHDACDTVHIMNSSGKAKNLYNDSENIVVAAIKN